jgi:hypothetical protein
MALTPKILSILQGNNQIAYHASSFNAFAGLIRMQGSSKTINCFTEAKGGFRRNLYNLDNPQPFFLDEMDLVTRLSGNLVVKFKGDADSKYDSKGQKMIGHERAFIPMPPKILLHKKSEEIGRRILKKYLPVFKSAWSDKKAEKDDLYLYDKNSFKTATPMSTEKALSNPDQVDIRTIFLAAQSPRSGIPESLFKQMADEYDREFEKLDKKTLLAIIKSSATGDDVDYVGYDEVWLHNIKILKVLVPARMEAQFKKTGYDKKFPVQPATNASVIDRFLRGF